MSEKINKFMVLTYSLLMNILIDNKISNLHALQILSLNIISSII